MRTYDSAFMYFLCFLFYLFGHVTVCFTLSYLNLFYCYFKMSACFLMRDKKKEYRFGGSGDGENRRRVGGGETVELYSEYIV